MVEKMDQELKKSQAELNAKAEKLRSEMQKVEDLEAQFTEVKDRKDRMESDIQTCTVRLGRANKLTSGLKNEHGRWKDNVAILD